MSQLLFTIDDLQARGIALKSLTENIDTTTATGKLVFHFFAALAEFEVSLLRERTRIALAARQKMGKTGGRPKALSEDQVKAVKALLASGDLTIPQIAKQIGCSISTLYRYAPGGKSSVQTAN
jgi:DNA invertase Pin-like site-specific DNA recombinase